MFQVLLGYLQSGYVVVPESVNVDCWKLIYQMAEYMCLNGLMGQCEGEMLQLLRDENCEELLGYAVEKGLDTLAMSCAELVVYCKMEQK